MSVPVDPLISDELGKMLIATLGVIGSGIIWAIKAGLNRIAKSFTDLTAAVKESNAEHKQTRESSEREHAKTRDTLNNEHRQTRELIVQMSTQIVEARSDVRDLLIAERAQRKAGRDRIKTPIETKIPNVP